MEAKQFLGFNRQTLRSISDDLHQRLLCRHPPAEASPRKRGSMIGLLLVILQVLRSSATPARAQEVLYMTHILRVRADA